MKQTKFSPDFSKWLVLQESKVVDRIYARIGRIEDFNHFGDVKRIDDEISELRWKSGLRVYFMMIEFFGASSVYLLWGGNKNSQKRDITFAKKLVRKYEKEI